MLKQASQVQKKIGDYVFLKTLGKGQQGIVYLAQSQTTNCEVAIKQIPKTKLNQKLLVRFQYEKDIGLLLFKHPNIVELFEVIQSTNNFYIVTEFCNSGDLRSYLNQQWYY